MQPCSCLLFVHTRCAMCNNSSSLTPFFIVLPTCIHALAAAFLSCRKCTFWTFDMSREREREECWRRLGNIGHKHTSQLERCMCNACRPTGMRRRAAAIVHNVSDNRTHERNCENIKWIKCTFLQTTFSCTGRMQFSCCCMCVWKNIDSLYVFNFQRIMLIHACVSILEKSVGVWERATEKSWPTDHPSLCNSLQCESGWLLQFLDAHPACGINFHFQKEGRESGREERQCTFKCTFPNLSLCIAVDSYVELSLQF